MNFNKATNKFENEIIWNNSNIKVNNKTVFYQFLLLKGIDCVNIVFNIDGRPLQYNEFVEAYNLYSFPLTV